MPGSSAGLLDGWMAAAVNDADAAGVHNRCARVDTARRPFIRTESPHVYGSDSIRSLLSRGEISKLSCNSPGNQTRRILACEMLAYTTATASYRVRLYYTLLYSTRLDHIISYYIILYYTMICYAMLCYTILCYATLRYALLCYTMYAHASLSQTYSASRMRRVQLENLRPSFYIICIYIYIYIYTTYIYIYICVMIIGIHMFLCVL